MLIIFCLGSNTFANSLADIINIEVDASNRFSSNGSAFYSLPQNEGISKYTLTNTIVNLSNGTSFDISMMVPNGWIKTMTNGIENPMIKYTSNKGEGELSIQYLLSYKNNYFDSELKKTLSNILTSRFNAYDIKYDSYRFNEDVLTFTFLTHNRIVSRGKIFFHNCEAFMVMINSTNLDLISVNDMDYIFNSMKY